MSGFSSLASVCVTASVLVCVLALVSASGVPEELESRQFHGVQGVFRELSTAEVAALPKLQAPQHSSRAIVTSGPYGFQSNTPSFPYSVSYSSSPNFIRWVIGTFTGVPSSGVAITSVSGTAVGSAFGGWVRFGVFNSTWIGTTGYDYRLDVGLGSTQGSYTSTDNAPQDYLGNEFVLQASSEFVLGVWAIYPAQTISLSSFSLTLNYAGGSWTISLP